MTNRLKQILPISVIILPYLFYTWFIFQFLHPVQYPDAFTYLWRQPFNLYYLLGRSLTQRIIFSLSANHLQVIAFVQLLVYLMTSLVVYFVLTQRKPYYLKMLIAALVALIFSSYNFNLTAVIINAEPIFISLMICFLFIIFLYRGAHRNILVFTFGAVFIFSKNVAPYALLILVVMWLATSFGSAAITRNERRVMISLTLLALGSIWVTNTFDDSVHVNVLNNLYRRVFVDQAVVKHFHSHYSMPIGPFVKQCKGESAGVACFGYSLLGVNQVTNNYELLTDEFGLTAWIEDQGQNAYLK